MSPRPLVLGVGHAPALARARRDIRLEFRRCEDPFDALALACSLPTPPVALVFDRASLPAEDIDDIADAATRAGLPTPFILEDDDDASLWDLIHEQAHPSTGSEHDLAGFPHPPADPDGTHLDESHHAARALVDAIEALLEGDLAMSAFIDACASFGVRLSDHPERGLAHAPVADEEGDPLAYLVGPEDLAPLLPVLARACAALASLDDAFDELLEDATTDRTTGLPDRAALLEELEARIDDARPRRREFTLVLLRPDEDPESPPMPIGDPDAFLAVVSWGVYALLSDDHATEETLDAFEGAWARVEFPWDGADPEALLETGESVLHAADQTDTV